MIRKIALTFFCIAFAGTAFAQGKDFSKVQITSKKVSKGIYMLTGQGGNLGISVGPDGVFLIDDQFAPLTDKIRGAIKKVSDQPIKFVLNTHWHSDHTGGNENLGSTGSIIVAHENVRKRLSTDQFMKAFNKTVPALPKAALPIVTFTEKVTFHLNGEDIEVIHAHNAHTDGDSIIFFKKANVIHTGDIFFNGIYPFIDVGAGGSMGGMIAAVDKILARIDKKTKIIPGHGSLADVKALKKYKKMLTSVQKSIGNLVKAGKSLDEVVAAKPTKAFDEKWGKGFLKPDEFVTIAYSSFKTPMK